jgi:hypothetical protein
VLPWEAHTEDMLVARASSRACRRYCSDSLGGISYTPEELGAIDAEEATGPAQPPAPVARGLSEAELTTFRNHIGALDDEQRAWAREQWKARGIPPLGPSAEATRLTEQHLPLIGALIAEAANLPTDAEIVDAPTGATVLPHTGLATDTVELPPCETDDDVADGVLVGVVPPDPDDNVPDRGGPVSIADPVDDKAAREYARQTREAIDRAKEAFGASVAEGVKCDICHKPLNERNDGCASKAHAF